MLRPLLPSAFCRPPSAFSHPPSAFSHPPSAFSHPPSAFCLLLSAFCLLPSLKAMDPYITINQSSASYPVYVGRNILGRTGSVLHPRGRVFVITSEALQSR